MKYQNKAKNSFLIGEINSEKPSEIEWVGQEKVENEENEEKGVTLPQTDHLNQCEEPNKKRKKWDANVKNYEFRSTPTYPQGQLPRKQNAIYA